MSSSSSAIGDCRSYNSMSPSTPLPMVKKKGSSSDVMVQQKERPKIKIIHIIAPEIIKTDVANFRDLVQRLTGKQKDATAAAGGEEEEEKKEETITTKKRQRPAVEKNDQLVQEENCNKKIKCEVKVEEGRFGYDHLDQNDLWMDLNPGGFLNFLEEDVYMATDLFQSPLGSMSRMDFVGEMYAS